MTIELDAPATAPRADLSANPLAARIAVSTVNYKAAELVLAGLPALLAELARFEEGVAIVVDNASPGGDGDRLAAGLEAMGSPEAVRLVRSPVNGGFAAGNNLAFAEAKTLGWAPDAILLLNPDAELRPGAIEEMVRVMFARPKVGVVGARLENEDGSTWIAALHFPSAMREFSGEFGLGVVQRRWPMLIEDTEVPVPCDWVSGACMMINARLLEAQGPLDEAYFLYFEEVDYQLQARRAGWEIWHVPGAQVMHIEGASTGIEHNKAKEGPMPAYWFDSWRRYYTKNHGAPYARAAALAKITGIVLGDLQRRVRGKPATRRPPRFLADFARACLLGGGPSSS
ncbi:glycosyltransferase family 2 protein [Albimonas sp. CAU 1670]|uniref:glycosyltransferase family 2 protein n=1 Tax=Albimonas sp. CAU 1670 TaxID=3032599 RepID=UPI0023DCC39A|nr:glycosyltransferase family 2 protein [Albimonas sp. CAU 1670]MDF2233225.1 glycosyltransferase family 2 protein [Albimonas sp. CAU 1670]